MRGALLAIVGFVLSGIGVAWSQPYSVRPVTLIVPFGAGGPVDTLARLLSEPMHVSLGQRVIIENVTGASGTIGVARAVRAAPDGYTVSIGNWPTHVVNGAIFTLQYDLLGDFEPVARLSSNPYVVVSRKDLPAQNLKDLIIRNARLADSVVNVAQDIGIERGRIVAIEHTLRAECPIYDAKGQLACPGLVETHIHLSLCAPDTARIESDHWRQGAQTGDVG